MKADFLLAILWDSNNLALKADADKEAFKLNNLEPICRQAPTWKKNEPRLIKTRPKDTFLKNLLIQMTFMARLAYINQEKWEEGNFKNAMVVVLWVNFAHCVCGNL